MRTITFGTLEFTNKLREAGFDEKQAAAVVRVVASSQGELVTKSHFDLKIEKELGPLKADLLLLKWMIGAILGSLLANIGKQFF